MDFQGDVHFIRIFDADEDEVTTTEVPGGVLLDVDGHVTFYIGETADSLNLIY